VSRSLFVSDIHISSPDDPKLGLFSEFLEKCKVIRPDHLFLVGDIFDLWIADRGYFIENYADIVKKIVQLKLLGTKVHYFEGNHDLDLKLYWQHKMGLDVQDSAAYYKLGSLDVRVEHGDQMDPSDHGYLFLRWLLRTRFMRGLGRALPNAVIRWIGQRASQASRGYTTTTKSASDDAVRAKIHTHASKVFKQKPFHLFVSGHVHVREDSSVEADGNRFRCINLGTWLKEPLVLDIQDDSLSLRPLDEFLYGK
jgi:UDP-2,3-diacylglucosamine hydrolase